MDIEFDATLAERPESPESLKSSRATHERNVAVLRDDVASHGTDVDATRLARELHRLGRVCSLLGDHPSALAALDEAVTGFERLDRPMATWRVRAVRAWAIERAGRAAEAEAELTRLLSEATAGHLRAYGEQAHRWRARARMVCGDAQGAMDDVEAALALVRARPRPSDDHIAALEAALGRLS